MSLRNKESCQPKVTYRDAVEARNGYSTELTCDLN